MRTYVARPKPLLSGLFSSKLEAEDKVRLCVVN